MTKVVALYARVSSERQVQQPIESQLAALRARAVADRCVVLPSDEHVDNESSGSTGRCPALERLRGRVGQGAVDMLDLDRSLCRRADEPPPLACAERRAEIPRRFAP